MLTFYQRFSSFSWINTSLCVVCIWSVSSIFKWLFLTTFSSFITSFWEEDLPNSSLSFSRISTLPAMFLYWASLDPRFYKFSFQISHISSFILTLNWWHHLMSLKKKIEPDKSLSSFCCEALILFSLVIIKEASFLSKIHCYSESYPCFSSLPFSLHYWLFPSEQKCALLSPIPNPALIPKLFELLSHFSASHPPSTFQNYKHIIFLLP